MSKEKPSSQYPFCRKICTLIAFPLLYSHTIPTDEVFTTFFIYRIDGEAIGILKMVELRSTTYPLTRID